ncbi:MAG: 3-hydroxyacyl-ACP dehydratase FabZ [Capsulimonadaceae bacterium]|nr:3-hydroxyacyl-ACP dehydratase FabZ [Capsulimonadaceae bacterium]
MTSSDGKSKEAATTMDIEQIKDCLPHRYPFLLVDRILELDPGKRAVGMKAVTINEPFFQGHFPIKAIMPGVLVIEAMAQVGGIMILAMEEHRGKLAYLAGIENCKFRLPVLPGDVLVTESTLVRARGSVGKVRVEARVNDKLAVEADIVFALKKP